MCHDEQGKHHTKLQPLAENRYHNGYTRVCQSSTILTNTILHMHTVSINKQLQFKLATRPMWPHDSKLHISIDIYSHVVIHTLGN